MLSCRWVGEFESPNGSAVYKSPLLAGMFGAMQAAFPRWDPELCVRERKTLIHGDMHLGNMVFSGALRPALTDRTDCRTSMHLERWGHRIRRAPRLLTCTAGGFSAGDEDAEPSLIDWQFFGAGSPAVELAYFMLMSLPPDPARDEALLRECEFLQTAASHAFAQNLASCADRKRTHRGSWDFDRSFRSHRAGRARCDWHQLRATGGLGRPDGDDDFCHAPTPPFYTKKLAVLIQHTLIPPRLFHATTPVVIDKNSCCWVVAQMVEATVHYATQRIRQKTLRAPFLLRNLADETLPQATRDSAAATIAVDANALGRVRAAQLFSPSHQFSRCRGTLTPPPLPHPPPKKQKKLQQPLSIS